MLWLQPSDKGKYLLEYVCQQLNLTETDYFGLRYVDTSGQRHWLHMAKLILKQVKEASPILFSFRVKFYPPAPGVVGAGARWQLVLQLRRDLLHARLAPTPPEAALLAALLVQMELGDYDPAIHVGNYVSEMRLLLRQTDAIEARIQELHRTPAEGADGAEGAGVKGLSAADAECAFLKLACQLDTYGLDPHPVKDGRGQQVWVGAGAAGLVALSAGRRLHHFRWLDVHKINFEGRMFIVHLNYPEKKHTVGFKCPSGAACRHLWCCAIEQMLFFTLPSSSEASVYTGGGLFSWGTKFRYAGRTERELLAGDEQEENGSVPSGGGGRGGDGRRKASSVPATPSTPLTNDFGYSSLPRSAHSAPLEEGGVGAGAGAGGADHCAAEGCLLAAGEGGADALADHRPGVVSWPCGGGGAGGGGDEAGACSHSSTESGGVGAGADWGAAAGGGPAPAVGGARRFNWVRALLPALALSLAALGALLLLLLEGGGGGGPAAAELRALKHVYYAPLRDYLRRRLIDLF